MRTYEHLLYLLLVVVIALSGCSPATPAPYVPVETIVAATYAAISAQTQAARPPNTPTPPPPTATHPPSTDTPTPTVTFVISTLTPPATSTPTPEPTRTNVTSGSGTVLYSCNINSTSPANGAELKAGQDFLWVWQVQNTGTTTWKPDTLKVVYDSGEQLSAKNSFSTDDVTKPGDVTQIKLKMHTPKAPGTYRTIWFLRKEIHSFCYVELKIIVK